MCSIQTAHTRARVYHALLAHTIKVLRLTCVKTSTSTVWAVFYLNIVTTQEFCPVWPYTLLLLPHACSYALLHVTVRRSLLHNVLQLGAPYLVIHLHVVCWDDDSSLFIRSCSKHYTCDTTCLQCLFPPLTGCTWSSLALLLCSCRSGMYMSATYTEVYRECTAVLDGFV